MESLLAAKEERRRELARLPIEKKIEILVQLQKMAQGILDTGKTTKREPWQVPWKL